MCSFEIACALNCLSRPLSEIAVERTLLDQHLQVRRRDVLYLVKMDCCLGRLYIALDTVQQVVRQCPPFAVLLLGLFLIMLLKLKRDPLGENEGEGRGDVVPGAEAIGIDMVSRRRSLQMKSKRPQQSPSSYSSCMVSRKV